MIWPLFEQGRLQIRPEKLQKLPKLLKKWHSWTCGKYTEGKKTNFKQYTTGDWSIWSWPASLQPIVFFLSKYFFACVLIWRHIASFNSEPEWCSCILTAKSCKYVESYFVKCGRDVKTLVKINWITILIRWQINEIFKGRRHAWWCGSTSQKINNVWRPPVYF